MEDIKVIAVVDADPSAMYKVAELVKATADGAVVMHRQDESGDEVIHAMAPDGWKVTATKNEGGSRIRYLERIQ